MNVYNSQITTDKILKFKNSDTLVTPYRHYYIKPFMQKLYLFGRQEALINIQMAPRLYAYPKCLFF